MSTINDNSQGYRPGMSEHSRDEEQFQVFLAKVLTVDYERKVCTIQDERTQTTYQDISVLPANASDFESTDVQMPEQGSTCLAVPISYDGGFAQIAILNWVVQDANRAQDAIAVRTIEGVPGYSDRKRGTYRKAYPGQKSVSSSSGYTEKVDGGWDRSSADFSRDKLDSHRRTWTQITSRRVDYTDAGITFSGPVHRPDADGLKPRLLPDGSKESVLYLQSGAELKDRYISSKQDVLPLSEKVERIQEFSLDHPVPIEILETDLFDQILGTFQDPWERTKVLQTGNVSHDDQTPSIDQDWDHPTAKDKKAIGPTTGEGVTPRRRAFIIERSQGTLVGYNRFDKVTYGKVLKPVIFPNKPFGRFGSDVESGYLPVQDSADHVEARLAASALSLRFPHEYNTTRFDVTKEGMLLMEIGSTIPKENSKFAGGYEHPHGAGRSVEAHLVGSLKLVVGKNRDEEDAIDLQALGQSVLRFGADDSSLPNLGRNILAQNRAKADSLQKRELQYWTKSKLKPGDAGDLEHKSGAENISIRAAMDGGTVIRMGARNPKSKRRHLVNGYQDGPGKTAWGAGDASRKDARSAGRPTYGAGDSVYAFHDLTSAGSPQVQMLPYNWSGPPVSDMDKHGLSLDVHAVRDILLRIGANPDSGQSLLLDLAGGLVACLGKDKQGRSITAALDGGVEMTIGQNTEKKGLRLEIKGDMDITVKGNYHMHVTGDTVWESTTHMHVVKTDYITKSQKHIDMALTRHTTESPDIVHNQGLYKSSENG
jgi:hypothetical protein